MSTILIIDDDPVSSDLASQRLQRAGHAVTVHLGPFGATVAARKPGIDLLIMDVFMPALDGPDLLELIRKSKIRSLPKIMFCSSMDEGPLRELAVRCTADGYVGKSATRSEFLAVVSAVLDGSFFDHRGVADTVREE